MRSFTFVDSQVFAAARYAFLNRKERCVFCHLSKKAKTNFGGLCTRPTGSRLWTRRALKRRLNRHATRMAWPGSRVQSFNIFLYGAVSVLGTSNLCVVPCTMQMRLPRPSPIKNVCCIDALSLSLFNRFAPWFLVVLGAARFCWIAIKSGSRFFFASLILRPCLQRCAQRRRLLSGIRPNCSDHEFTYDWIWIAVLVVFLVTRFSTRSRI